MSGENCLYNVANLLNARYIAFLSSCHYTQLRDDVLAMRRQAYTVEHRIALRPVCCWMKYLKGFISDTTSRRSILGPPDCFGSRFYHGIGDDSDTFTVFKISTPIITPRNERRKDSSVELTRSREWILPQMPWHLSAAVSRHPWCHRCFPRFDASVSLWSRVEYSWKVPDMAANDQSSRCSGAKPVSGSSSWIRLEKELEYFTCLEPFHTLDLGVDSRLVTVIFEIRFTSILSLLNSRRPTFPH